MSWRTMLVRGTCGGSRTVPASRYSRWSTPWQTVSQRPALLSPPRCCWGVALTLYVVALLTIFAREWCVRSWTRHGASLAHLSRLLEGATGVALLLIGLAPFVSVI
jgi:hypothetical protein